MTLLIAKIEDKKIMVLADTQLTFDEKDGKKPVEGLKIFFINSYTAIGYCGSPEDAHKIIRHVYKHDSTKSLNSIAQKIGLLRDGEECPDFILMKSGQNPKIIKTDFLLVYFIISLESIFFSANFPISLYDKTKITKNNTKRIINLMLHGFS